MNSQLTPQRAAQILLERQRARQSLLHFTKFTFPQYIIEPVHTLMAATLDRCVNGEIKKLMIFAPPQHGKSQAVSVHFPAYWLGRRPDDPVILTSYGASLAESKSRQTRALVESIEYGALFPSVKTDPGHRRIDNWGIANQRGGLVSAGVGGPITGHGAMLGLIDDPFENWEQAQSITTRDKVWDWYKGTFHTRIWENGTIILIMTRWHEDDLAGRLLNEQASDWTVLRLPAISEAQAERDENNRRLGLTQGQPDPLGREPGEALSPKRFSIGALTLIQRDVGSLVWSSEYQGVPRSMEGNRFKRSYFEIIDVMPAAVKKRVRYWDNAATSDGGCYTVGLLLAELLDGHYVVEDVVRGQWSSDTRNQKIKQTADLDRTAYNNSVKTYVEQEPGSAGIDAVNAIIKLLSGVAIFADKATGDKDTRLEPFAAQAEAGNVKLKRGAWNSAYIEEMGAVPNGKYRDQADASAGAFNRLMSGREAGIGW